MNKKRAILSAIALMAVFTAALFLILVTYRCNVDVADKQNTISIHGEVIAKSLDSFVVETSPVSGQQTFYVFRVEEDTLMLDSDGNKIGFDDILINADVVVEIYHGDHAYCSEVRHEWLPSEIHIEK